MQNHVVARPHGLALGIFACSACVLQGPLGQLDTDTDTDGSATASGETTAGPGHTSAEETTAGDEGPTPIDPGPPPVGPAKLDILFVFDNSGSMGEEQGALAASIDAMVIALEQVEGISYRIGTTTTDTGNPWCAATSPANGRLEVSSCLGRTGDFVFGGAPPVDATEACTALCTLDEITLNPTSTAEDPTARIRPWIEGGSEGSNVDGATVADALRCSMPQGIAGCGFESPLEAVRMAVERSADPSDAQYGFIRADAHLAIVVVTDETDCSYVDPSIFLGPNDGGNPVFWADPESSVPTSAVCWNAGVQCTDGPGTYAECHAENYDVDGNPGAIDSLAVLQPVDGYRDFIAGVLADKRAAADASVFMFGVVGVPPGYPAAPLVYADGDDAQRLSDFGIGVGCSSEFGSATPSVRERELIESFRYEGMTSGVYSICQPPLSDVYALMIGQIAPFLGG